MDSICSAIAYAEFKTLTGAENTRAARCGSTNERIDFALKKFGFEAPVFLASVQPRVEDVMERDVVSAHRSEPVYEAMARIGERRFRGLPVVDDDNRCVGLISSFKISQYLFPPRDNARASRDVFASVGDIANTIGGVLLISAETDETRHFTLVVGAMYTDSFQKRLALLDCENTVLIVGDRWNIQRLAIEAGVRAMIVTGGLPVDEDVLALARSKGTAVISSPHDTATTVILARGAVRSERMLYEDFILVPPDMPLSEAERMVALSPQFAFPVLDHDRRLIGIISKSDFIKPVTRQLILVDHNELTQAVDGAKDIPIVEILDHHRIGPPETDAPILFLNRPVGSTCTIVATLFQQAGIPIPKNLAGLIMCGVISDTLNLTSPTTTEVDRQVMQELSRIAGITPLTLAEEIFSVGSPLLTMTPEQAITADCKEYEERGERFSVSQIEELSFAHFEEKKQGLLEALEAYRTAHRYFFSTLLVTDVNTQNSVLLLRGSPSFTKLIDYPEAGEGSWRLDGVVSRKKQLMPYLASLMARI